MIVQTAPAVRAALGEAFGLPMGTNTQGKMVSALRRIGFDKVFDTNFGADLTIMEEAHEFLDRVQNDGILPMITSCSPGWIKYCEHYFPDMTENLSSCKSPQQMFGAVENPTMQREMVSVRKTSFLSASCLVRQRNLKSAVMTRCQRCPGCRLLSHDQRTCPHDQTRGLKLPVASR